MGPKLLGWPQRHPWLKEGNVTDPGLMTLGWSYHLGPTVQLLYLDLDILFGARGITRHKRLEMLNGISV